MENAKIKLAIILFMLGAVAANIENEHKKENFLKTVDGYIKPRRNCHKNKDSSILENRENDNPGKADDDTDTPLLLSWIQQIFGRPTTTTEAPVTTPPASCPDCTCGKTQPKIVGGSETERNEYPWMAALLYGQSERFYCGATLINDRYVITASHCVDGFDKSKIKVKFLDHDMSIKDDKTITVSVAKITKHPRYNPRTFDNDIAIIKLSKALRLNAELIPACLATPKLTYTGFEAKVAGWGTLKEGGNVATKLQHVVVPVISNYNCRHKTGYSEKRITDNMMCAGFIEGKRDSCQGDSGGPLTVVNQESGQHQLIGVVSWGEGCAREKYPGVYSRVNRYRSWIRNNTLDACKCEVY